MKVLKEEVFRKTLIKCVVACSKMFAFAALFALASLGSKAMAANSVMSDNFDDNVVNSVLWAPYASGGSSIAEANQRLEISFPASSTGAAFAAGVNSRCQLHGDFDVEVGYELLNWPLANGVRIGLRAAGGIMGRTSFCKNPDNDYPGWPREVFLADFGNGVSGITEAGILPGKLRLVRKGSSLNGYSFVSGDWVSVLTGSSSTSDTGIVISAWSHDFIFTGNEVKLAFDNLVVNEGQVVCQGMVAVPIDIKPNSIPNSINLGSNGSVPVAILSTASFDATQVDTATITLSGAPVNLTGKGTLMYSLEDVDGDGRTDMLVHITTSALILNENDTTAVLVGNMRDGAVIRGTDSVRIVP